VRSFFETRETEIRASALPPVRVLVSEPDVVSRRLICALLERKSGMMVTSVDDSESEKKHPPPGMNPSLAWPRH